MKKFFEFSLAIFLIIIVLGLIGLFLGLAGVVFYGIGWTIGWFIHLMVGPDILFGITFEQFVGIIFLLVGFFGAGKVSVNHDELKEKIDDSIKDSIKKILKEYRGY